MPYTAAPLPDTMRAMVLNRITSLDRTRTPLTLTNLPVPQPKSGQVLIRVSACGVCHTELDEIEGRTPPSRFPMTPGHQVVGRIAAAAPDVSGFSTGERVGVGWIHSSCGRCSHCRAGLENLCPDFEATGRDAHGGYAEYMTVDHRAVFRIPEIFTDVQAAPLLCAGSVGFRSLKLTGIRNGDALGLTGFGASGHLVLKMVRYRFPDTPVIVFARSPAERRFAVELGALWAGAADETPPLGLDAVIDTTPVWVPIVRALENLKPGGRLVINAIRKESADQAVLLELDYARHLWMEKEIKTVANVTRGDIQEFLSLAAQIPILPEVQQFRLEDANAALAELKQRNIRGAKVLHIA